MCKLELVLTGGKQMDSLKKKTHLIYYSFNNLIKSHVQATISIHIKQHCVAANTNVDLHKQKFPDLQPPSPSVFIFKNYF